MKTGKSVLLGVVLTVLTAGLPILCQLARVLVNQVGYDPVGSKNAVIQGQKGDTFDAFTVRELATRSPVLTGLYVTWS